MKQSLAKMNPEIKALWVNALENEGYLQTRKNLHDAQGYCCLGVLCDIHRKQTGEQNSWVDDQSDNDGPCKGYLGEVAVLPHEITAWAGLTAGNPAIYDDDGFLTSLAELNDKGYSFEDLSVLIKEQY